MSLKDPNPLNPCAPRRVAMLRALVDNTRPVTGFANVEDHFADNAVWSYGMLPRDKHLMPWRIEDRMRSLGGNRVQAGLWRSFAVRDGNLVTGQQNLSGEETARRVVEALGR
jgi:putative intracellular protease/amidase